jgi:uncharacterized protein YPO0396
MFMSNTNAWEHTMSEFGETIQTRIETGRWVVSTIDERREELAKALADKTPMETSQWTSLFEGLQTGLKTKNEDLFEAENALAQERGDDPEERAKRDEAVESIRNTLQSHRALLESVEGTKVVERVGLGGSMPEQPNELAAYARNVVQSLRDVGATYSGPGGVEVKTAKLADDLKTAHDELKSALADMNDEQQQRDGLLVERNEALEAWKDVYQGVASMAEGALRFAGEDVLADRLRPTSRRTQGSESPAEGASETEGESTPNDEVAEAASGGSASN